MIASMSFFSGRGEGNESGWGRRSMRMDVRLLEMVENLVKFIVNLDIKLI